MVLTNTLRTGVAGGLLQNVEDETTHVAFGSGSGTPTENDSMMENEIIRVAREEVSRDVATGETTISATLGLTQANGNTINRVATFDAASGGNMSSHSVISEVAKTNEKELRVDIIITTEVT